MKEFKGKTAVVTGGASGIGLAMAEHFATHGMRIVLADIQDDALGKAEAGFKARGVEVLAVKADVSKSAEVEALAKAAVGAFGGVHILCNNAGVASAGLSWERSEADWQWVMGVNLWAVIHGVRIFTPIMLKQGTEGHIVNTASLAGLISGPAMATYNVTKHGVVTLSETLYHELRLQGAKIGVSVLCPGWVKTQIVDSGRNRPADLANPAGSGGPGPAEQMLEKMVRQFVDQGLKPERVAELVMEAIAADRFYILTHPEWKELIRLRMDDILNERNPTYRAMG